MSIDTLTSCLMCSHSYWNDEAWSKCLVACTKYHTIHTYSAEDRERGIALQLIASECDDYLDRRKVIMPDPSYWRLFGMSTDAKFNKDHHNSH